MGLISKVSSWLRPPAAPVDSVRQAVERAVERVDPLLRGAGGYQRKLAAAADRALGYCEGMVASIPGPMDVSERVYAADPLVHAIFPAADEIGATLGKSRDLREFLAEPSHRSADAIYALLGMRRQEKSVLGMSLHGDVVQSETPQTLLYFTDHTLKSPALDAEMSKRRLREECFDSLVLSFADRVAQLRRERLALEGKAGMLRAQARAGVAPADLPALDVLMRDSVAALSPERLVEALSAWLAAPEAHLRIEPVSVTVDSLGVEKGADDGAPGVHTLRFPEMFGRDRRHWLVVLARIPREEAMAALERQSRAHRYIVI